MIKILRLLLGMVALVVIIAFAIANRTPVDVSFAPLPITIELPVYGVFLLGPGGRRAGRRHRRLARRPRQAARGAEGAQPGLGAREPAQRPQARGRSASRPKRYAGRTRELAAPAGTRLGRPRRGRQLDRAAAPDRSARLEDHHHRRRHHGPVQRLGAAAAPAMRSRSTSRGRSPIRSAPRSTSIG